MSIAAAYPTERHTNRRFARIVQNYAARLSEIVRTFHPRVSRVARPCSDRQRSDFDLRLARRAKSFPDRIHIEQLEIFARVGVSWEERATRQRLNRNPIN